MQATIQKWGNSHGIRLPKPILDLVFLKENDDVQIFTEEDKIIIQKLHPKSEHKTLQQRFEEFYGKDFETILKENPYDYQETDWGQSVGREVW